MQPSHKTMTGGNHHLGAKKVITCFFCGKQGHVSGECRTRIASEGSHKVPPSTAPVAAAVPSQADRKPVVCILCHQVGHKSPQCPKS